jgi:hypothetical protein
VALLGTLLLGGCLSRGQPSGPSPNPRYWKQLRFANWTYPKGDGTFDANEREISVPELSFRVRAESLMVANKRQAGFGAADYSLQQFSVNLANGKVSETPPAVWAAARPIAFHMDSPFHEAPEVTAGTVHYCGREFGGQGASLRGHALSPDGSWLAVISWTGTNPQPKHLFDLTVARGRVFVDVYRVSSGKKITDFSLDYLPVFPDVILNSIGWISDRHLIIPAASRNTAWICDLLPDLPVERGVAWDFIEEGSEILGFGEASDKTESNSARLPARFVAVRVEKGRLYYIGHHVAELENTWSQGSGEIANLSPGIQRMKIITANQRRVERVALTGPESGHVVTFATARDLGSTTDDPPNWRSGGGAVAVSAKPFLGSGSAQTFEFALADRKGIQDLSQSEFLIQSDRTRKGGCLFLLDHSKNELVLFDDAAGAPVGRLKANESASLQNSQCTVSNPIVLTESPESILLQVHVEFSARFSGRRNIYGRGQDVTSRSSRWQWLGSWIVRPN